MEKYMNFNLPVLNKPLMALMLSSIIASTSQAETKRESETTTRQSAPIIDINTGEEQPGAKASLRRTENEVCYHLRTNGLPEGAYTNWWVIYNNTDACQNPSGFGNMSCGEADLDNPDVQATVMWATGGVVSFTGKTMFGACTSIGELSHAVLPMGSGQGLLDANGAEIQLVIRYHGPAEVTDATLLGEQLNSFMGGCSDPDNGIEGYDCYDPQMVFIDAQ